jgi:diaminopimelate decarboxylase
MTPDQDRLPAIGPALRMAARRFGTPIYLTDIATLDAAAAAIRDAFSDPWIRQYSVKANDTPAIVALVGQRGFGANVVSGGEWAIARRAGFSNDRITLEGIGKTDSDLRAAVRAWQAGDPLRWVSLESTDEAEVIERLAMGGKARDPNRRSRRSVLDVLLRLNPEVAPETHAGLAVGAAASKFGMTETELSQVVERLGDGPIRPRGIHIHVGSQLGAVDAWRDATRRALALLALIRGSRPEFDTLDVGGGFPVAPVGTPSPAPERFAREIPSLVDGIPPERTPARWAIEPGRVVVARAGWLLSRVLHVRDRGGRQVVIDAGMTELIRPALYGAFHPIVAVTSLGEPVDEPGPASAGEIARVDGPICESTDTLGEHALPALRRGDLVAIRDAGAYAASMASTYNGRRRPRQVLLEADGRLVLAGRPAPAGRRERLG